MKLTASHKHFMLKLLESIPVTEELRHFFRSPEVISVMLCNVRSDTET